MPAPDVSAEIVSLRPEITRFLCARRRRRHVLAPDAEDEVQEALVEIMRSVPQYRAELGAFRPWAFGIALNVHRRFARNRQRMQNCFAELDASVEEHAALEPSPERRMQINEARRLVERANRDMPEAQLAALYLHVFEGHSHAEIAVELGITEKASKQLVYRARAYLAQQGLDQETFFSAPPVFIELRARENEARAVWREIYDACFRLGHVAVLLMALGFAGPHRPLAFAQAWIAGFVREHGVVLEHAASSPDKPTQSQDDAVPDDTKTTVNTASIGRSVSAHPHRKITAKDKPRFQAKPYDLSLMVRKNP